MRILYASPLYFAPPHIGGGERYALTLARAVAQAAGDSASVELLSIGPRASRVHSGVALRLVPAAGPVDQELDALSWDLPDAVASADLVHVHHPFTRFGQAVALVARTLDKPLVLTHHGAITVDHDDVQATLDLADCVVAYSQFGASRMPSRNTVVIPGGVDTDIFGPPKHRRDRDGFLFVGRVLPHKGVERMLRAWPAGVPLTICGTFDHEEYAAKVIPLALAKHVEIEVAPPDDELRVRYGNAKALMLPSVYVDSDGDVQREPELMGLTPLEAMACGTPAIVSDVGALAEFVEHGVTGLVVRTNVELRDAVMALADDPELVARLGAAARERVDERFGHRVAGRALLALYRSLVGAAVRP